MTSLVITEYVRPPIPTTLFDWVAYIGDEEGGPAGHGQNECEALRALANELALFWVESHEGMK